MKRTVLSALLAASAIYAAPAVAAVTVSYDGVVKDHSVDYIQFTHFGGKIDIVTAGRSFPELYNPMIRLFLNNGTSAPNLTGTQIGVADSELTLPFFDLKAFLTVNPLIAGNYILAVGDSFLTTQEARSGVADSPYVFDLKYTASFKSDKAVVFGAPVPEPATWAMMIAGFGMVGAGMRRRAPKVTVTYA